MVPRGLDGGFDGGLDGDLIMLERSVPIREEFWQF